MRCSIAALVLVPGMFGLAAEGRAEDQVGGTCRHACRAGEVFVPAGVYQPFFKSGTENRLLPVEPLCLGATPVTHEEFLEFVRDHAAWRKSHAKAIFAEDGYLQDWQDDLAPPPEMLSQPVTYVSWFAAGAYCEAQGARLPTVAEWERAGGATGSATSAAAATPFAFAMGRSAPELARTPLEFPGIWEWTANFNSALVSGRIGTSAGADSSQFCGDGIRAVDPSNYGAFLRYSFRSSLRGNFTLKNLGFRCVREAP